MPPRQAFHTDAKDPKSGFHACAAGTEASKLCCLLHFLHIISESNWCQVTSKQMTQTNEVSDYFEKFPGKLKKMML